MTNDLMIYKLKRMFLWVSKETSKRIFHEKMHFPDIKEINCLTTGPYNRTIRWKDYITNYAQR